jgi:NADPH:quinone reductase-like Zn-dependent oxidoreductase
MRAATATAADPEQPLRALTVGEAPEPTPPDGWVTVEVRAASLNHHDLWSLRGVGLPADRLPMILGCDAAGVDPDGNEVVIYPVVADPADPRGYSLFSERHPGTLAERVAAPRDNLIPKPAGISFAEAACLPTAWLTAFHMLTTRGRIDEGGSVLVQGAGGGVATAAVALALAMDKRVYATSRDPEKREQIAALGATAVEPGARLPERVDVVIESVGAPTFDHSMKCAAPGARIVVCGATGGHLATIDLRRLFAMRLELLGSTMGTQAELAALLDLCLEKDLRPLIDSTYGFSAIADAFAHLASGNVFGKVAIDFLH